MRIQSLAFRLALLLGTLVGESVARSSFLFVEGPLVRCLGMPLSSRDSLWGSTGGIPRERGMGRLCMSAGGRDRVGAAPRKSKNSSSSSSRRWLSEHVNDKWVKDAQKEGYRSRAAFKLLQLQESDQLLKEGQAVLDLGSAPGSWSQVARKLIGSKGTVIATDILEMVPLPGVVFIQGDFLQEFSRNEVEIALGGKRVDVMLSDLAPNMSGNSIYDQGRAYNLVDIALHMADTWLKKGGSTAIKVFRGEGFDECMEKMQSKFRSVKIRKPKASRDRSTEIYLEQGSKGNTEHREQLVDVVRDSSNLGGIEGAGGKGKRKKLDDLMEGMYDD